MCTSLLNFTRFPHLQGCATSSRTLNFNGRILRHAYFFIGLTWNPLFLRGRCRPVQRSGNFLFSGSSSYLPVRHYPWAAWPPATPLRSKSLLSHQPNRPTSCAAIPLKSTPCTFSAGTCASSPATRMAGWFSGTCRSNAQSWSGNRMRLLCWGWAVGGRRSSRERKFFFILMVARVLIGNVGTVETIICTSGR